MGISNERLDKAKREEILRENRRKIVKDMRDRGYTSSKIAEKLEIPLSTLRSIERSE